MTALLDLVRPDFPLQHALLAAAAAGLACPLVGVYFLLRRLVFWGVALPQAAAAGVSLTFLLQGAALGRWLGAEAGERTLALLGALAFVTAAIVLLSLLGRAKEGAAEGRVGALYAVCAAAAVLFVSWNARGEAEMMSLLRGELLAISEKDFHLMLDALFLTSAAALLFQEEFLLVSFDRDFAASLGRRVLLWDAALYLLVGLTVSLGVMTVGPLVTFGLLLLPPMAARPWCGGMLSFSLLSSGLGGACAAAGFAAAYARDLPAGPSIVLCAAGALGASTAARSLLGYR